MEGGLMVGQRSTEIGIGEGKRVTIGNRGNSKVGGEITDVSG